MNGQTEIIYNQIGNMREKNNFFKLKLNILTFLSYRKESRYFDLRILWCASSARRYSISFWSETPQLNQDLFWPPEHLHCSDSENINHRSMQIHLLG